MKKNNRYINLIASVLCLAIVFAGGIYACLARVTVNEYENRYAEKISRPRMKAYLDLSFQDSVEKGMSDQLPFAIPLKIAYNNCFSTYNKSVMQWVQNRQVTDSVHDELLVANENSEKTDEEIAAEDAEKKLQEEIQKARGIRQELRIAQGLIPVAVGEGLKEYNGRLIQAMRPQDEWANKFDIKIENLNSIMSSYPWLDYYLYAIECDSDIDIETGERNYFYEYLCDGLNIKDDHCACFMINSYAELDAYYYKSDHHWNHRGSYMAYRNILKWLLPDEQALSPVGIYDIGDFVGSRAIGDLSYYKDILTAYEFDFPEFEVTINGENVSEYGSQSTCIADAKNGVYQSSTSYGKFYGSDFGEVIINNPNSENGSILLFGDSYDNALLNLLASHFTTLYCIDLRTYEDETGYSFDYQYYLREHDIDRVLFIGDEVFWQSGAFIIE